VPLCADSKLHYERYCPYSLIDGELVSAVIEADDQQSTDADTDQLILTDDSKSVSSSKHYACLHLLIGTHLRATEHKQSHGITLCYKSVLELPTPDGWKAELTWVVGYMPKWFTCRQTDTHPGSNSAQCRAFIKTNASAVTPRYCLLVLFTSLIILSGRPSSLTARLF